MNRLLVVLPNWFGETLFVTPLLRVLRHQRPDAYVATLGWPSCREVLLHNPHIDELLDYDERQAHRGLVGRWRLIRTLRTHRFDTAFILRKSLSRTLLLALAGIPGRIGFENAKTGWLLTRRVSPDSMPRHKAFSYLPLLEAMGLSVVLHPYEYTVSAEERYAARDKCQPPFPAQKVSDTSGPLIVFHHGAKWPHKRWAADRFATLGDRVVAAHQARVVITGGPGDVALAESIKQGMHQSAILVAGKTTLRQLGALVEQAHLVVSNDTGVLHIAAALHRPMVALYGPTSPLLTGPLGDPQRTVVLHHADCCPRIPCRRPDRPAHPGMDSITVEEAYDAAHRLLMQRDAVHT